MVDAGWSDPKRAGPVLERIPLHRFAGTYIYTVQTYTHNQCLEQKFKNKQNQLKL